MNKVSDALEIGGNGLMYILTASQTKEVFEIISLILSILISVIIIVSKIIKWYQDAKKDGKITKDEIHDGIDILIEGVEEIKDKTKKGDKHV